MFHFLKEVRDINRFNHILLILFEEGFGFLLDKIKLKRRITLSHRFKKKKVEAKPEVRLRKTLERLGPTFIKLGQLLSLRPDLIPYSYAKELEKLQDKVEPFSFEEAKPIIEQELGKPLHSIFNHFEKTPIASASISQVHKARLAEKTVAVKVQRPKVKRTMETDIEIMFYIAKLLEKHVEELKGYQPTKIVEEFASWTRRELDFRIEAENANIFFQNFRGSRTVHIPKVYESAEKVLVMDYLDGIPLHDIAAVRKKRFDIEKVMGNGLDAILTMVFVHGFFHGDPHPGNILVMGNNNVGFVDFGIVGSFSQELKEKCISLFGGVVEQDSEKIYQTFMAMGAFEEPGFQGSRFQEEIGNLIRPLKEARLKDIKVSYVLEKVLDLSLKHRVKVPVELVLFGKVIVTLEGIGLEYDPDFQLVKHCRPFLEKVIKHTPSEKMRAIAQDVNAFASFLRKLPYRTERVFQKIEEGKLKVDIEDADIGSLALEIDKSSNRIVYGLVIAAFVIAGSLVMPIGKAVFLGLPFLSLVLFFFAFFFSTILFVSILKEKRAR